jgi:hypothetical protein
MQLRPYQIENANKLTEIISKYKLAYFQAEVRTGKTLTSLEVAKLLSKNNVLFITKLKAISSIQSDFEAMKFTYKLTCINKESLHKIEENNFDFIIIDESHQYASFPKPSKYTLDIKKRFSKIPMLLLSGTPTPESEMQIYHQLYLSNYNPFNQFRNFYQFFNGNNCVKVDFVINGFNKADYSNSVENIYKFIAIKKREVSKLNTDYDIIINQFNKYQNELIERQKKSIELIKNSYKHLVLSFSQNEAGFESKVEEHILYVKMKDTTYNLANKLLKDRVIEKGDNVILADTSVKLQQKLHQIYSGTIKFENEERLVFDKTKAEFIKEKFKGYKLAIIYKFKAELMMLKEVFGSEITEDLHEFNSTSKHIVGQIQSIREGVNLSKANYLILLNLDFSATSYWQIRDRMTTKERLKNDVYFIFSHGGIEEKIFESVGKKKDYTINKFNKHYGIKASN